MKSITRKNWKKGKEQRPEGLIPREEIRVEIMRLLGGRCARCGFRDPRALQIDHVYGGGSREIRELGKKQMYVQILESVKRGSKRYQILCANCNWIKRRERREEGDYLKARNPIVGL